MPDLIPTDFKPLSLGDNPFIDPLGPMYGKLEGDALALGLLVEERHCNPGRHCHGGMLMTLADMLLILNANAQTKMDKFMVTINLTCDFVGPAPLGTWLEGRATVSRASPRLVFVNGEFRAGDQPVLRTNGIFKPTSAFRRTFTFADLVPTDAPHT